MKKLAAVLISLILMISLVACGSDATSGSTDSSEKLDKSSAEIEEKIPFEECIVVDNDQCLIKITGIEPDNMWGYTLNTYLENKSDKTYMFAIESAAINGVQTDPLFASEVAAGKKANKKISFSMSELATNGIENFTDIELSFRVYDSNDWSADNVAEETVHVYPFGEEKATEYVRQNQSTDTVVIDNDSATVIVTGYSEDSIWGYTINLYLVNKTNDELMFSVDEASINGFMADPFWASSVSAGKVKFTSMSWSNSALETNNITTVEEIEMKFKIYKSDDWSAKDIFNEIITLKP